MAKVSPSQWPTSSPSKDGSGSALCGRPSVWTTRQLLFSSSNCTNKPGVCTNWNGYGSIKNIPGTPRGIQFTEARPNSKSVVVIALIFAAAQGWKGGGSSGVALGSNCLLRAGLNEKPPAVPGNQTPEKSG